MIHLMEKEKIITKAMLGRLAKRQAGKMLMASNIAIYLWMVMSVPLCILLFTHLSVKVFAVLGSVVMATFDALLWRICIVEQNQQALDSVTVRLLPVMKKESSTTKDGAEDNFGCYLTFGGYDKYKVSESVYERVAEGDICYVVSMTKEGSSQIIGIYPKAEYSIGKDINGVNRVLLQQAHYPTETIQTTS